jgi:signal transduction histidine kinase
VSRVSVAERSTPTGTRVRVFLCDDAPALRRRLRDLLADAEDVEVIGEASDPVEALPLIADAKPDVVVMDLSMPRMDGLEAIPHVAEHAPEAGIVIYSGFLGDAMGPRALQVGADSYIGKEEDFEDMLETVRTVARDRRAGVRPTVAPVRPREPAPAPVRPSVPWRKRLRDALAKRLDADADGSRSLLDALSRQDAMALVLGGFALAVVLSALIHQTSWVALMCVGPIMLAGMRFGARSVLLTGPLATLIMLSEHISDGPPSERSWIACATIAFFGMGLAPGRFSDRARAMIDRGEKANRELERSNAELGQFAYVASHDLGEPLRTIAGFTELLERRYRGQLDEKADRYIEHIVGGTTRMQNLIDDLLQYSRAGQMEMNVEWLELGEVVDGAIVALAAAIGAEGAAVSRDQLPAVHGDRDQLGQVLQNLIGNALKFSREGVTPEIHVSAERVGDAWTVRVRDNGIGMEPKSSERIFQMFQRLHAQHEFPGTGIGLAICQRAIQRHGGEIGVESVPGEGSTFFFTLPDPS